MTSSPLLQVKQLSKTFTLHNQGGASLPVLADISFSLHAGECLVLDGPSGAGKSTLLRCLYGNYLPSSGAIQISPPNQGTLDIQHASPQEILCLRRTSLAYVSQFLRVIPRVSALDIVAEPLVEMGTSYAEARQQASELLTQLNIQERLWTLPPATFSGGEQQRINLARGFISSKPIMLLDEPTASLDATNRQIVVELIREACARGTGMIGIFHDSHVRNEVATRRLDIQPINSMRDAICSPSN